MDWPDWLITVATASGTSAALVALLDLYKDRANRGAQRQTQRLEWLRERLKVLSDQLVELATISEQLVSVVTTNPAWSADVLEESSENYCRLHDRLDEVDERLLGLGATMTDSALDNALHEVGNQITAVRRTLPKMKPYRDGEAFDWSPARDANIALASAVQVAHHRIDQLACGDPVRPAKHLVRGIRAIGASIG